jgi:predicted O-linked N-acetylglucosamine transferase (SPINDLY family)
MGVPVVSVAGHTHAGRMGLSVLRAAGLGEWVAEDDAGYVERCVRWAADLDALARVRAGLREQVQGSALCDEAGHVRALEALYREAWVRWCRGAQTGA